MKSPPAMMGSWRILARGTTEWWSALPCLAVAIRFQMEADEHKLRIRTLKRSMYTGHEAKRLWFATDTGHLNGLGSAMRSA